MKYEDFVSAFRRQVFSIDFRRQLALAIEICQRLLPDYINFSEKYKTGDPQILTDAMAMVRSAQSQPADGLLISRTLSQIDTITPDMGDYNSDVMASYALNTCVAYYNLVEFLADRSPGHIFDIGICLTDTIDLIILEEQTPGNTETDDHPLMEQTRQYLLKASA